MKKEVLKLEEKNQIRELYYEHGYSKSKIEKVTKHNRRTISKCVAKESFSEEKKSPKRKTKLDNYKSDIDLWLEEDIKARAKQRHTAKRVYDRLMEKHGENFDCSYRTIAIYVAEKKQALFKQEPGHLPLQHKFGEAQVDFGKAEFIESGIKHSGSYLVVSFPASNAGFFQLFKGETQECLFEGLINVFNHIGGVPRKLWFDNMSTVVTAIEKGGNRKVTESFLKFKMHYGFATTFCNPASGNEKGNVENKVGYFRRNFLVPVPEFNSLREYNKELLAKSDKDNEKPHYTKEKRVSELFLEDKSKLLYLPEKEYLNFKYETVKTDGYGKFTLNSGVHTYSSSPKFARDTITVKITAHEVIPLDEEYKPIVTHKRLYGSQKQEQMNWLPYLNTLSKRPRALKYSEIYELFPQTVKSIFDNSDFEKHSEILKAVAEISIKSSFETAVEVLEKLTEYNKFDYESIIALHNRMTTPVLNLPEIKLSANVPKLEEINMDISDYDKFLEIGGIPNV